MLILGIIERLAGVLVIVVNLRAESKWRFSGLGFFTSGP
jgi:hypothetical protein